MCILLTTNSHPDYPLILISNRDEYFVRPTSPAHFHHDETILSPYDLARPEHGTWIGVNRSGKLAVLVNYREADPDKSIGEISRGLLPMSFLESELRADDWEIALLKSYDGQLFNRIGGFSLLFGDLNLSSETNRIEPLNILSNRGDRSRVFIDESPKIAVETNDMVPPNDETSNPNEINTFGLSNSLFSDPWPKVKLGEQLLSETINEAVTYKFEESQLMDELFAILSHDTYPVADDTATSMENLRYSIFIPPVENKTFNENLPNNGVMGRYYGTRTQTIVLLDKSGNLTYRERNLHTKDIAEERISENTFRFSLKESPDVKSSHI